MARADISAKIVVPKPCCREAIPVRMPRTLWRFGPRVTSRLPTGGG